MKSNPRGTSDVRPRSIYRGLPRRARCGPFIEDYLRGRQAGGIRPDGSAQAARRAAPRRHKGDLPLGGLEHPQRGLGAGDDDHAAQSSYVGCDLFWRRLKGTPNKIEVVGAKALCEMDAEPLGTDIIHSVINPINKLTGAIHIYGGDFFAAERSEWDSMTLLEHRSDGERVKRVFEEANARYEAGKHVGAS